jgi:hypothetical protein|tara:strand:- start:88 stop:381 length:294 start_codon:yes stop_codon:yes gene_type:complete
MPFSKGDNNINRQGRPKDSLNNSTLLKKEILSQLSLILSEQMQKDVIDKTLSKASPSARLRFIEGCLKYIIPIPTMEGELDTILEQLEKIKYEKKVA